MKLDQQHYDNAAGALRAMLKAQGKSVPPSTGDIISDVAELSATLFGAVEQESAATALQTTNPTMTVTERCLLARKQAGH